MRTVMCGFLIYALVIICSATTIHQVASLSSLLPTANSPSHHVTEQQQEGHVVVKVLFDSSNHGHRSIQYHPEQSERITACVTALQDYKNANNKKDESSLPLHLIDYASEQQQQQQQQQQPATSIAGTEHIPFSEDELSYARSILVKTHSEEYVAGFENRCRLSRQQRLEEGKSPLGFIGYVDDDTFLTTETYDVCLRACAAWIRCVDLVVHVPTTTDDPVDNIPTTTTTTAMALTRPPGHHATQTLANGFCIFNFAAAAAIHAVDHLKLKQVSILDWDVHYGQGVANIVQHMPQVRYVSMHQTPAFPYQGEKNEISGPCGNILTIPLPPHSNWTNCYQAFFEIQVLPFVYSNCGGDGDEDNDNDDNDLDPATVSSWEPELIIVCAGYDALWSEELASCYLTASDFGKMTHLLRERIDCQSNTKKPPPGVMLGLEGGYQLKKDLNGGNLADAVVETVKALGCHRNPSYSEKEVD